MRKIIILMLILAIFITACSGAIPQDKQEDVVSTTNKEVTVDKEIAQPTETKEDTGAISTVTEQITEITSEADDVDELDDLSADLEDINW